MQINLPDVPNKVICHDSPIPSGEEELRKELSEIKELVMFYNHAEAQLEPYVSQS